jgi:hypothetical protein
MLCRKVSIHDECSDKLIPLSYECLETFGPLMQTYEGYLSLPVIREINDQAVDMQGRRWQWIHLEISLAPMDVLAHSSSCSSGLAIVAKPSIIVCTDSVKVGQHGILDV